MTETDDLIVRARERVGTVLKGKYRLDRVLGVGGMAAVYQATHTRNAGKVAVKILHREVSIDRDLRTRFLHEGYAANVIEHPGAIRVLDDDTAEDGSAFLVMELLDGETVDARWERSGRRLGVAEVVSIALDLLDVLSAAHARGIVHRDCKPENLFITRDGRTKVLDFGVARVREASPTRTKSGAIFGTPAYMAPEQALGRQREIDALTDVWAVGATMFSLLTGRFAHEGETPEEMVVRAATTLVLPIASVVGSVPEPIAAVIDRALRFDRAERWPSAAAMRDALVQAREEALLSIAEDFESDAKTRLAPAPQMTLPPAADGEQESTVPLPTLHRSSTVGGVSSNSNRRRGQAFGSALAAVLRRARDWLHRHRASDAARRAWATIAALAATNALRHRRRLVLATASGLVASFAVGTIALFAMRTTSRPAPASVSASGTTSSIAGPPASAREAPVSSTTEPSEPGAPSIPPEAPPSTTSAPPVIAPTAVTPTRPPVAQPRPPPTPKPPRLRRDPLAP